MQCVELLSVPEKTFQCRQNIVTILVAFETNLAQRLAHKSLAYQHRCRSLITFCKACGYLPSRRASTPVSQ